MEAEEPRPTMTNGHENGDYSSHDEYDMEPEPLRAALISKDIMDILDSYTPGSLGK